MIGRLTGRLAAKQPPQVLLDVGGVAYEVDVPMSTFYSLPATGEPVTLYTHLVVREDAQSLYGFGTQEERAAFRQLIRIAGVGPGLRHLGFTVEDDGDVGVPAPETRDPGSANARYLEPIYHVCNRLRLRVRPRLRLRLRGRLLLHSQLS